MSHFADRLAAAARAKGTALCVGLDPRWDALPTALRARHADGTLGWAASAPYPGIIVTAGGPTIPVALQDQLALGGRLVIPVGVHQRRQQLLWVIREGETTWRQEA